MRIAILTNEYPPHIYGGARVHVEYLTRELTRVEGNHSVEVQPRYSSCTRSLTEPPIILHLAPDFGISTTTHL